uniref:Uncharacterized protein MANES_02G078000 n=1 Tax=Rhizophora mucronata TaxID=61149 RepID=A0A2P2KP29_RHIMU
MTRNKSYTTFYNGNILRSKMAFHYRERETVSNFKNAANI